MRFLVISILIVLILPLYGVCKVPPYVDKIIAEEGMGGAGVRDQQRRRDVQWLRFISVLES